MSELVVLVHGFFRTDKDMAFLEAGLRKAGYAALSVKLPAFFGSLKACATVLERQLVEVAPKFRRIHFVAHSMGGLIVREYLRQADAARVGRCVFIGTPHRGSRLADIASRTLLLPCILRPIADLTSRRCAVLSRLPAGVELGLIAGTDNNLLLGKMFLPIESDGRVAVAAVAAADASEMIPLPFGHNDIHHQARTLEQVEAFLRTGTFAAADGGRGAIRRSIPTSESAPMPDPESQQCCTRAFAPRFSFLSP